MSSPTPFRGRTRNDLIPMRRLYRFEKAGGHWAEIRERKVTQWQAFEFLVFVDGSLLESQMFHGARLPEYPAALAARVKQFSKDDWQLVSGPDDPTL